MKSQESSDINNQYWIDFIPHFEISDKLEFYGDASFRIREQGVRNAYTVRPSIRFQAAPIISLHIGLGFFFNHLKDGNNFLEIRPWEGLRIAWPDIGRFRFKHYVRLEQRYFTYKNKEDDLFLHRGRYRIKTKVPLNKKAVQSDVFFLPFAFEWLGTANDDASFIWASEARLTVGVGYAFKKKWIVEFEYMYWWGKDSPAEEFGPTDQVFRLRFLKNGWLLGE